MLLAKVKAVLKRVRPQSESMYRDRQKRDCGERESTMLALEKGNAREAVERENGCSLLLARCFR